MCFNLKNHSAEAARFSAESAVQLLDFIQIQDSIHLQLQFGLEPYGMSRNFSGNDMLRHDVCDDG